MENSMRESSSPTTSISDTRRRGTGKPGSAAGRGLLACAFVVALSACSADEAQSTGSTETTAPAAASSAPAPSATPTGTPENFDLAEPHPGEVKVDGVSPSGRVVLSEKGTGTGTYTVDGGLEPGQVLSMSASCTPGEKVTITHSGLGGYGTECGSPNKVLFYSAPSSEALPDVEVIVETESGGPFWLMGWVHDPL